MAVELPPRYEVHQIPREELCAADGCFGQRQRVVHYDIPLCLYHFAHAWAAYANHMDEVEQRVETLGDERFVNVEKTVRPAQPVVYYVAMNGRVKIGTTTSFIRRMREFYIQPQDVLAIEPGGRKEEAARHQQFAAYRKKGTELFVRCTMLDEVIQHLRALYPDPWSSAQLLNQKAVETVVMKLGEAKAQGLAHH